MGKDDHNWCPFLFPSAEYGSPSSPPSSPPSSESDPSSSPPSDSYTHSSSYYSCRSSPSINYAPTEESSVERVSQASRFLQLNHETSAATTDISIGTISEQATSATSAGHKKKNQKCKFIGCSKGARGASDFCKAHGGGRRCQHLGCTKSAEGMTDLCIAHGGGRRCGFPRGCTRLHEASRGFALGMVVGRDVWLMAVHEVQEDIFKALDEAIVALAAVAMVFVNCVLISNLIYVFFFIIGKEEHLLEELNPRL
ncbi:probable WRKY transcription factor 19 [Mercurialis annua]|uniref:probable WRKY transcription factor 19 n=1 Tax=Mercurialis annua TaxID=3986 RepID=UPI00216097FD|nr:probable WRKY transcription factor 19 [Mercurialis annua]